MLRARCLLALSNYCSRIAKDAKVVDINDHEDVFWSEAW